jgi:hypothetical protein
MFMIPPVKARPGQAVARAADAAVGLHLLINTEVDPACRGIGDAGRPGRVSVDDLGGGAADGAGELGGGEGREADGPAGRVVGEKGCDVVGLAGHARQPADLAAPQGDDLRVAQPGRARQPNRSEQHGNARRTHVSLLGLSPAHQRTNKHGHTGRFAQSTADASPPSGVSTFNQNILKY